mmetsp:Transcript_13391/g.18308  ORF Transcript_13391/g.18308 Transcript_13391/m.18308 type:complete len:153 (-) Transcript_13391:62-520(-)|eukprot:CAMPEP_0196592830 /NCGR_PEP_ID=MMETSP1081-20130531/73936_1 /TAXON_ID=36882 /ORGANISM="Pyramimonas amylifera, Strain CCMP720" /LENGTH=152 /DNA_ID=CAMNT_0041916639 /DNA_START=221 /DNA_END=679 /DNA_ORIENTATION=+
MAKEFGSRADMISGKIDEVSRNSIWREHCKKELHHHSLNTNFNIADPKSMPTFPEKPNYVMPNTRMNPKDLEEATQTLKEVCSIKNGELLPFEKHASPVTSAHELGWHSRTQLVKKHPMFEYSRNFCEITKYADAYYAMSGTTPYSRKDPGS